MRENCPARGILLSFEGLDGSGKTTQIKLLEKYFKKQGLKYLICREPGGTEIGEQIRELLLKNRDNEMSVWSEMLLFLAARAQLFEEMIEPALNQDYIVVCDRFIDSTLAYQGYARGLSREQIKQLNALVTKNFVPHRTYLLDLSVENAGNRLDERKESNHFDLAAFAFRERVREAYLDIREQYPERILTLDADLGEEEIQNLILNDLKDLQAKILAIQNKEEDLL